MFAKYEVTNESLITDTDALVSYIQNDLNGTIPEKYKDYQAKAFGYSKSNVEFINGYINFLQMIRDTNPDSIIICTFAPI